MANYIPRGHLWLRRRSDAFPVADPGELEVLHQLAFKLRYKVSRRTVREDAEIPVLNNSSAVGPLGFAVSHRGTENSDEMFFRFPLVDFEDIADLERGLPDFFRELRELGIEAEMNFDFTPEGVDGEDEITLLWFPDSRAVSRVDLPYHAAAPSGLTADDSSSAEAIPTSDPVSRNEDGVATVSSAWLADVESSLVKPDDFGAPAPNQTPPHSDSNDDPDWMKF